MMTATKATAAVVAVKLTNVADWLLSLVPGWHQIPDVPRESLEWLVTAGIAFLVVYYAPANKTTVQAPE